MRMYAYFSGQRRSSSRHNLINESMIQITHYSPVRLNDRPTELSSNIKCCQVSIQTDFRTSNWTFLFGPWGLCGLQLDDDGSDTVWFQNKPVDVIPLKLEHSPKGKTLPPNIHTHTHTRPTPHAYIMLHRWLVLKTCHFLLSCLKEEDLLLDTMLSYLSSPGLHWTSF